MLKKYTATFLSFMGLLSPIFASLNSWLILGEPPSWQILLSTSIVSLGLFIVYQAELKQGYILKKKKEPLLEEAEVKS
jgi:drug/metabolite transporter (DMT)-like permease